MPHLQDDTAQEKHRKETIVGSVNIIDSSSSRAEELPIQFATPNFLGSSDPVVAMANKVSIAVVDSSFESVEQNQCHSFSSPSPRRIIKTLITPTSSIGNINSTSSNSSAIDDVSTTDTESISSRKNNAGPIWTTVCSNSRLSNSPIPVKRRLSQIEDEEPLLISKQQQNLQHIIGESTFFKYGESPSTSESSRPAIIRRGSSLALANRTAVMDRRQEELSKTKPKKLKSEDKIDGAEGDGTISGTSAVGKTTTVEAVAAASTIADMRKNNPVISPITSGGEDASNGILQPPPVGHHPHHILHQRFHQSVVAPPGFHPHPVSFGGHPFGPTGGYPMAYPGYPPHIPPCTVPPLMVGQFHGHPAAGFYAQYPPGFHPHPIHQHSGQHLPPFVPPYGHITGATLSVAKTSSNKSSTNAEDKDDKNNLMAVMPSMYIRSNSTLDQSMNSTTSSKPGVVGKPISANRCVPLQEPIPSKHWGNAETAENTVLPDFHRLVNYPDYLSKSRSLVTGDAGAPGCSKAVGGKKHCVMCGKFRICSASSLIEKGRAVISGDDGTAHIIPRQNKGLCTACDVTVWVLVDDGLEIKWCKGCKNFRQWAAFGEKGSATKCVRCRERQREKYAMQKNAKRARRANKSGDTLKSLPQGLSSSSLRPSSSSNQHIGSVEQKEEKQFAAARGLTSLMNAAAAL